MAAKKKTRKKVPSKSSYKSPYHPSHPARNNNSLLMLVVACAFVSSSYLLFTHVSRTKMMMQNDISAPNMDQTMLNDHELVVQLNEQNNSSEYGNVVLTDMMNGTTKVKIELKNAPKEVAQPAHIHYGTCINIGEVKYPLTNVVNGMSETIVNASLSDIKSQGSVSINVHKSVSQAKVYVSCGNIN